jgi:hypothetical protein
MKLPFKNTGLTKQTVPHYEFFSHGPRRPETSQIHKYRCRSSKALEIRYLFLKTKNWDAYYHLGGRVGGRKQNF